MILFFLIFFLLATRIVQDALRVDLESEHDRLEEVNRSDANVVGAESGLELELVDLGRVARLGAKQTAHEHARLVQILKEKARHGLVAEHGALRLQHVDVGRVVEQNF